MSGIHLIDCSKQFQMALTMKIYQFKFGKWLGMDYQRFLKTLIGMHKVHIALDLEWYIIVGKYIL